MSMMGHNSGDEDYFAAAGELRQFAEQIEACDAEIADVNDRKKEIRAEAKARGYDTKVLGIVLRRRKMDRDARAEQDAIQEMYESVLLV